MNINTQQVRGALLVIMALVSLGLVVWAELTGHAIDDTIKTLLGVVIGFIGAQSSAQQGSDNATPTAQPLVVRVVHAQSLEATQAPNQGQES